MTLSMAIRPRVLLLPRLAGRDLVLKVFLLVMKTHNL